MKHVHFIGIGGTGLSAIARLLLERGYTVSGSDRTASPLFDALTAAGVKTYLGHAPEQVAGADLVVRSSAIPNDNPEVLAALNAGIPVVKRSDFLSELTAGKETLAIAGTHGKTTTTGMLIWILENLSAHPSFISGGVVTQLGCNARAGSGPHFVIEADEYDSMFLGLTPKIAVITNIEHDHPDCFPTEADYLQTFSSFLSLVRPDGLAIICRDDPNARALMDQFKAEKLLAFGYGLSADADYRAENVQFVDGLPKFSLVHREPSGETSLLGEVNLSVPGQHNVVNATAALAVIHQLGLPVEDAIEALAQFSGAGRRFEVLGEANGITIVDDYGHHPTEIYATLQAAKSRYPERRIWAIWQPHTYTRTRTLESAFTQSLQQADRAIVLKIYAAREQDPGYSAEKIAHALPNGMGTYISEANDAVIYLMENLVPGDVAVFLSAGDATQISHTLLQKLSHQAGSKESEA